MIKLSEKPALPPDVEVILHERGNRLVEQANVGYVVIDSRFIPLERARLVIDVFKLVEIERDGPLTLYVPAGNKP